MIFHTVNKSMWNPVNLNNIKITDEYSAYACLINVTKYTYLFSHLAVHLKKCHNF